MSSETRLRWARHHLPGGFPGGVRLSPSCLGGLRGRRKGGGGQSATGGGVRFWPQRTRFKSPSGPHLRSAASVWLCGNQYGRSSTYLAGSLCDPADSLPSRSQMTQTRDSRGHPHTHVHSGIIDKGQERKQPNCPSKDKRINKTSCIQTRERGSSIKSREALTFAKTRTRP